MYNTNLPKMYEKFLKEIEGSDGFPVENTGIILYEKRDLEERNTTYEVEEYELEFFMIGQDGDLAFFIKISIPRASCGTNSNESVLHLNSVM